MKSLIIIISQMGFFQANEHKYAIIFFLTNNHFQMEDDKKFEVGYF
jgi:hypothetical protein